MAGLLDVLLCCLYFNQCIDIIYIQSQRKRSYSSVQIRFIYYNITFLQFNSNKILLSMNCSWIWELNCKLFFWRKSDSKKIELIRKCNFIKKKSVSLFHLLDVNFILCWFYLVTEFKTLSLDNHTKKYNWILCLPLHTQITFFLFTQFPLVQTDLCNFEYFSKYVTSLVLKCHI